jgi:hypothetical protein
VLQTHELPIPLTEDSQKLQSAILHSVADIAPYAALACEQPGTWVTVLTGDPPPGYEAILVGADCRIFHAVSPDTVSRAPGLRLPRRSPRLGPAEYAGQS